MCEICLRFQVVLASGELIGYDILVFATGSNGKFPVKFDDTMDAEQAVGLYEDLAKKVYEHFFSFFYRTEQVFTKHDHFQ